MRMLRELPGLLGVTLVLLAGVGSHLSAQDPGSGGENEECGRLRLDLQETAIHAGPGQECSGLELDVYGVKSRLAGCPSFVVVTPAHYIVVPGEIHARPAQGESVEQLLVQYACVTRWLFFTRCELQDVRTIGALPSYKLVPC